MRHTWKNVAYLVKCCTPGEIRRIWKLRHVWKNSTLGKVRHTWGNAAHLEKCDTLEKMRHTWKKVRHTWRIAANLGKCGALENCGTLGKCGALVKKCATVEEMRHTWNLRHIWLVVVASCQTNRDKLRPDVPLNLYADFTISFTSWRTTWTLLDES